MVQQGLTGRRMTYPAHSHPIPAHAAGRPGATDHSDRSGRHRGRCAAPTRRRRCRATCRARQQPAAREELRHVVDLSTMSSCSLMVSARPQTPWPKSRSGRELAQDLTSAASTCESSNSATPGSAAARELKCCGHAGRRYVKKSKSAKYDYK